MYSDQELSAQLKNPIGERGIEIGNFMNENNFKMTLHSISNLDINNQDIILELGHGNSGHLSELFKINNNIIYHGLETSELMHSEAVRINDGFLQEKKAYFCIYDGKHIPYSDNSFDRMFTVNTIYFWVKPYLLLAELYRVLKPKGKFNITFSQKRFMEQWKYTQFGFELYDIKKLLKLLESTRFKISNIETASEVVKIPSGEVVYREFTTVSIQK